MHTVLINALVNSIKFKICDVLIIHVIGALFNFKMLSK